MNNSKLFTYTETLGLGVLTGLVIVVGSFKGVGEGSVKVVLRW